jgi:hypothetical protein
MRWSCTLVAMAVLAVTACGGDPAQCTPGESEACACTNGESGAQVCQSDGSFAACECDSGAGGNPAQDEQCVVDAAVLPVLTPSPACDDCVRASCGEQCQAYLAGYSDALSYGQCERNCISAAEACAAPCDGMTGADYNDCIGSCNVSEAQCHQGCIADYSSGRALCGTLLQCEALWCQAPCNVS